LSNIDAFFAGIFAFAAKRSRDYDDLSSCSKERNFEPREIAPRAPAGSVA
jgi:hypothetical protein